MRKNLLLFMGMVMTMLFTSQKALAFNDYTKEFFFKVSAESSPSAAGKVYVSVYSYPPTDDHYATKSEDTGVAAKGYGEGDPEPESAMGDRELHAKANPGFKFAGWSRKDAPTEIISTDEDYTAEFEATSTDKENPTCIEYLANFEELGYVNDGGYYIKNVETGKFIDQGQWWGTHATLDNSGILFSTIYDAESKTYTLSSDLGYFGNNEYVDAPENIAGKWSLIMDPATGLFTITEGGRNLCVDGVNVYLNADNAAATWQLVPAADRSQYSLVSFSNPYEYTNNIKHAAFEANKGAWTVQGATNMGQLDTNRGGDFSAESWNSASFSVKQEIEGMRVGIYRLTFNGYYRYNVEGGENNNNAAIAAHADGTEVINAYIQVNAQSVNLLSVADEASVALNGGVTPNTIGEAQAAFAKGAYLNEIIFSVGDDEKMSIDIRKDEQANTDWTIFDNLKLEYLGDFPEMLSDRINSDIALSDEESVAIVTGETPLIITCTAEATNMTISDASKVNLYAGVKDGDGWFTYDELAKDQNCVVTISEEGNKTLIKIEATFDTSDVTDGSSYCIKMAEGALDLYGRTNPLYEQRFYFSDSWTGVEAVKVAKSGETDGKFVENSNIVIVKNGVKYTINGIKK